jgi:hypothetical protein
LSPEISALGSFPLCGVRVREAAMAYQRDPSRLAETALIVFLLATVNASLFSVIYRMLR